MKFLKKKFYLTQIFPIRTNLVTVLDQTVSILIEAVFYLVTNPEIETYL